MSANDDERDRARSKLLIEVDAFRTTAHEVHKTLAEAAEKFGYVAQAADAIYDGYQGITGSQDPDVFEYTVSGLNLIETLQSQLGQFSASLDTSLIDPLAVSMEMVWADVAASGSALELPGFAATAQACPFLPSADPERYAEKLAGLDPSLAASYRQAWSSRFAALDDPERVGLWELRQVFDHLFDRLAPDDDVRGSKHWAEKNGDKPNAIHRIERLAYAAEKQVADGNQRSVLLASAKDMLKTYEKLNQAHKRGALTAITARATFDAMDNIIRRWLDALFGDGEE